MRQPPPALPRSRGVVGSRQRESARFWQLVAGGSAIAAVLLVGLIVWLSGGGATTSQPDRKLESSSSEKADNARLPLIAEEVV